MSENEFQNKVYERWGRYPPRSNRGRAITGVLLFFIGILLLLKTANIVWFPSWFFSWPMLLIVLGVLSGIKHGFRGSFWLLLFVAGGLWLYANVYNVNIRPYIVPIILIALGLMFILRPNRSRRCREWQRHHHDARWERDSVPRGGPPAVAASANEFDSRDFIDITAVFGGVKKNVLSKNFMGGDVTTFMGGCEIDLSQADFNGRIKIDTSNIFGGTKLIVPATWDVQNEITAIFGGVDDKRQISGVTMDPNKILVLDGTCMFGGIEIRSF